MIEHFALETSEYSQRKIFFHRPDPSEKGFYRQVTVLNGFFYGSKAKANVTENRQFTLHSPIEEDFYKTEDKVSTGDFFDFLEFIGFDYKKKTYRTGERILKWNGQFFS